MPLSGTVHLSQKRLFGLRKKGYYVRVIYFLGRVEAEGSSGDAMQ
jgi:hypothetical protein